MRPVHRALFLLFSALIVSRWCHLGIVWVEEAYPSAAAIQILNGKHLYRDFWYDKPPLSALIYVLWNARAGWPLRLAGALYCFACCLMLYRFARDLWGEREGLAAAGLLGFFLIFELPSGAMALAPDLLMLLPHAAAVYFAWRRRPFLSGMMCGLAMLINTKAIFVLAACAIWGVRSVPVLLVGFALTNVGALAFLAATGALTGYIEQVWRWGALYARNGFAFQTVFTRTAGWLGYHAVLAVAAAWFFLRERESTLKRPMALWLALSFGAICAGWRFFPRYYFQILPVAVLLGARGLLLMNRTRLLALALLIIPLARFGPRYATLAADRLRGVPHHWSDLALSDDSRDAAALVPKIGTLLVWGYRPDVFVWTRLPAGTPYLDSQPLTGVIADRHLSNSAPAETIESARRRLGLHRFHPDYIVDGLGPLNPALAITAEPDLRQWLSQYREIGRTRHSIVYTLRE